jgi:hypothetical protein
LCKAGDGGLTLQPIQGDLALRYHQPGVRPPDLIAFRMHVLAEFEGRTDAAVVLEHVAAGKGRACWHDAGVPRTLDLDAVTADSVPEFPEAPVNFTPMPPGFLTVVDEASRTAGRGPGGRFALTRIQLRGQEGGRGGHGRPAAAGAGRGFSLTWSNDVLIPRSSVFGCRESDCGGEVLLGRTRTHVALRCGPWTLLLAIDPNSRYPDTQAIIPRSVASPPASSSTTRTPPSWRRSCRSRPAPAISTHP